jgi:predicted nucleic acid-binding protein
MMIDPNEMKKKLLHADIRDLEAVSKQLRNKVSIDMLFQPVSTQMLTELYEHLKKHEPEALERIMKLTDSYKEDLDDKG